MAYIRKVIAPEEIRRQEAICASIAARLREQGARPLAMVDTYGCQQNEADSEKLRGYLAEMGYGFTNDEFAADVIVVNTCAVREHAEMRVLGNVGALNHTKKARPSQIIAVCGCMVQQEHMAEKIKKSYPIVDLVFGPHELWRFPELLETVMEKGKRVFAADKNDGAVAEGIPLRRDGKVKAWLSIMYGCNNFCTYCIVPYVRGRERSRDSGEVLREIEGLAASGVGEITLLGQNVNSYRSDCDFAGLIKKIAAIPGDFRLSFMTSHPKDVSDDLIALFSGTPHLAPRFHLPLQSGSDGILQKMNRHYDTARYLSIVSRLRERNPGITLTSDIIVGFPGETEEDFEKTLSILSDVRFDMIYSFIYSPRKGTPAADYPDRIDPAVSRARMKRLLDLQCAISSERNQPLVGKTLSILCDGPSPDGTPGVMSGRTDGGKLVHFPAPTDLTGRFVQVKIERADAFALHGSISENETKEESR